MAADVYIVIPDPTTRAVVAQHWVGGNRVRERLHEVLGRPPDHEVRGLASWGNITESEAHRVAEAHYANGISAVGIEQLGMEWPVGQYWWAVWIDW
jgi:hypothetical protein